jgi:hypothetical protein
MTNARVFQYRYPNTNSRATTTLPNPRYIRILSDTAEQQIPNESFTVDDTGIAGEYCNGNHTCHARHIQLETAILMEFPGYVLGVTKNIVEIAYAPSCIAFFAKYCTAVVCHRRTPISDTVTTI